MFVSTAMLPLERTITYRDMSSFIQVFLKLKQGLSPLKLVYLLFLYKCYLFISKTITNLALYRPNFIGPNIGRKSGEYLNEKTIIIDVQN